MPFGEEGEEGDLRRRVEVGNRLRAAEEERIRARDEMLLRNYRDAMRGVGNGNPVGEQLPPFQPPPQAQNQFLYEWNNGRGKKKESPMKGREDKKFIRPLVGRQVVKLERIRTSGKALDVDVEAEMTKIEEGGLPEPLPLTWDLYDWRNGFVVYEGPPSTIQALRALGHVFIEGEVSIKEGSGLQAEEKSNPLRVIRESVPIS